MPRIKFINTNGIVIEAEGKVGESLMTTAVNAGIDAIAAECGGACACGTCHCYIDGDWLSRLPEAETQEKDMLDCVIAPRPESRLSCQIRLIEAFDGLVVRLPETQH